MSKGNNRSDFVTVVAWIFIVITGLSTVMAFFQNLMLRTFFTGDLKNTMTQGQAMENMPEAAQFMMGNFEYLFIVFFLVSLLAFIASIGLLKRKNWARLTFIVLMALGVVWNIGSLFLQQAFIPDMPQMNDPGVTEHFESMMGTMNLMTYVFVIGFSLLFSWIILKLCSARVREEFGAT